MKTFKSTVHSAKWRRFNGVVYIKSPSMSDRGIASIEESIFANFKQIELPPSNGRWRNAKHPFRLSVAKTSKL